MPNPPRFYFSPQLVANRRKAREAEAPRSDLLNCTTCKHMVECSKPKKSFNYKCGEYRAYPAATREQFMDNLDFDKIAEQVEEERATLSRIEAMIEQSIKDSTAGIQTDFLLEDQDIPQAANYLDFYTNPDFKGNFTPLAKQIEAVSELLTEICYNPKCTDVEYSKVMPYDATIDQLRERVTFLENGKCPNPGCGCTKIDMWTKYKARKATTLALLAGQRCITANSRVLTNQGIIKIGKMGYGRKYGFTDRETYLSLETGCVVRSTKFYKAKAEKVLKVHLSNGYEIEGTVEHPLVTYKGDKKLSELHVGDCLPIYVGQNLWGNSKYSLRALYRSTINQLNIIANKRINTKSYKIKSNGYVDQDLAKFIGLWVAEGSSTKTSISLANIDQEILDFCMKEMLKLYPDAKVNYQSRNLVINSVYLSYHFDKLVEGARGGSYKKKIPSYIMQSCKDTVCQFLQGYFEGDSGVVCGSKEKFGKGSVECSSMSKTLIYDISSLLSNIGIIHKIRHKKIVYNEQPKTVYEIIIKGLEPLNLFQKEIGFLTSRKKKELTALLVRRTLRVNKVPYWFEVYPVVIKKDFMDIIGEITDYFSSTMRLREGSICRKRGASIRSFFPLNSDFTRIYSDNVSLSKRRLHSVYTTMTTHTKWKNVPTDLQNKLIVFYNTYYKDDVYWTTVKTIKQSKLEKKTYDFFVPTHHKFMANGILNKNSGKDWTVASTIAYQDHKLLKLRSPSKALHQASSSAVFQSFTAITFKQAKDATFKPYLEFVESSKWFNTYRNMLDDVGQRKGKELYKIGAETIEWKYHNLFSTIESPDVRASRGKARFCLTGDTLVNTDRGLIRLNDKSIILDAAAVGNGHYVITNQMYSGKKEVFYLATEYGYSIKCTKDHQIFTLNPSLETEMKELRHIKIGDYVGIQLGGKFPTILNLKKYIPKVDICLYREFIDALVGKKDKFKVDFAMKFGFKNKNVAWSVLDSFTRRGVITRVKNGTYLSNIKNAKDFYQSKFDDRINALYPEQMTEELATLLGYMVSEGCYTKDEKEFVFTNLDKRVSIHFNECYYRCFGIHVKTSTHKTKQGKTNYISRISYNNVKGYFRYLGLQNNSYSHNKCIPWCILQSPKNCVKAFLSALFEGDGCLVRKRNTVSYATRSRKLRKQLQILLLKFGVVSRYTRVDKDREPCYFIRMSVYDSIKFMQNIGFVFKQERLITLKRRPTSFDAYKVPYLKEMVVKSGKIGVDISLDSILNDKSVFNKNSWGYNKEWLKKNYPDLFIKVSRLIDTNMIWVKVKDIQSIGIKKTYDITVDQAEKFSANGIVVHNCFSITEVAYFYAQSKGTIKLDAGGIIEAYQNSMAGIVSGYERCVKEGRYDMPVPLSLYASSARSAKDQIVTLVKAADEDPTIVARWYCLAGDTLIPTNKGLMRLDQIHHSNKVETQKQNLQTEGHTGTVSITHSHYTGKKKVIRLTTEHGYSLKPSKDHQFLVLRDNNYVWVKAGKLQQGDYLCINKKSLYGGKFVLQHNDLGININPNVSFFIAALVAEGYYTSECNNCSTGIYNSNMQYLKKLQTIIKKEFKANSTIQLSTKVGTSKLHKGKEIISKKDVYHLRIHGRKFSDLWDAMGLTNYRTKDKTPSWFKVVPTSILQTDKRSQLAFIGSYVEADGYIGNGKICIYSVSKNLLQQMQTMLLNLGVTSYIKGITLITASKTDAAKLYKMIKNYVVSKHTTKFDIDNIYSREGVPVEYVRNFIKSRIIKGSKPTKCINDKGDIITLNSKGTDCWIRRTIINGKSKRLTYDNIKKGLYKPFFDDLKRISKIEHDNLMLVVNKKYLYSKVLTVEDAGVEHTYDLTVDNKEFPSFTANGIIVHNSTFEFNPNVSEAALAFIKRTNPEKYKTSFLSIPANSTAPFIPDRRLIMNCTSKTRTNALRCRNKEVVTPIKARLTSGSLSISDSADTESPKILSIDASENQNSFAMTIGHNVEDPKTGIRYTVVDGMCEIIPSKNKPCSYPDIYEEVIAPICQAMNVGLVMIDRYPGAIQLVQTIERELGIPGIKRSVKYSDSTYLKQGFMSGLIDLPKLEEEKYEEIKKLADNGYPFSFNRKPVCHLVMQAITVEDMLGRKVDKGEGFTDDLFYALTNLYAACNDDSIADQFLGDQPNDDINNQVFLGAVGGEGIQSRAVELYGGEKIGGEKIGGEEKSGSSTSIGIMIGY